MMIVQSVQGGSSGKIDATRYQGEMLGKNGPEIDSLTLWRGPGRARIDVENAAPGVRAGQVHYQDNGGNKYYYDPNTQLFFSQKTQELAPKAVQNLLQDKDFARAIDKALFTYLGAKRT